MTRHGRLDNQSCLIMGGTTGIGLATARRFLREGARVVVVGRTEEHGEAAQDLLTDLGPAWFLTADVRDARSVDVAFREAIAWLGGRLDVLFHVAGISGRRYGDGPLDECTDEGWDMVLDLNARGTFLTNRAAVRQMLSQPLDAHGLRGSILNMGSVLGWSPSPRHFGTFAYAASKGAILSMTLAAAARYAPDRVRFNVLAPGLIDTPMASRAVSDPAIQTYLTQKQPLAGGPGTALDCAEAALYLCEPAARFLTGVVLNVDGGWCVSEGAATSSPHDPPADVCDQYLRAVRQALDEIAATQLDAVRQAAERFAATILRGRLVHVFGTGHSRMTVEEMFPRYGSFPGFHPIVELSMTFHNPVVGANGQRQAMFLENVAGFGPVLWRNFATAPDDCLLAISTSGCSAVTIDVALEAKRLGMFVVALTSLPHSAVSTSKHESGKKLHEVADLTIDQRAPAGDSSVWIAGLETPVAPLSSVTGCTIINLLKAEVARLLTERGQPPKVLTAACHLGADRAGQLFEETYDDYRRRIGVLYR